MRRTSDPGYVQTVRGQPYYANAPARSFWWLIFLPILVAAVTGQWIHLLGTVMVFLGFWGANARFSPVQGAIAWLPLIGVAVYAAFVPRVGIPLVAWGIIAWVVGSIECRLTLDPYVAGNDG